jgi:hypothetical protein
VVASFVDVLRKALAPKFPAFERAARPHSPPPPRPQPTALPKPATPPRPRLPHPANSGDPPAHYSGPIRLLTPLLSSNYNARQSPPQTRPASPICGPANPTPASP